MKKIILILFAFITLSACGQENSESQMSERVMNRSNLEQEIDSSFSEKIVLLSEKSYSISQAFIEYNDNDEPKTLNVYYSQSIKNQLKNYFQDEQNLDNWEKENNSKILYGPYKSNVKLIVRYELSQNARRLENTTNISGKRVYTGTNGSEDGVGNFEFNISGITYTFVYLESSNLEYEKKKEQVGKFINTLDE